MSLITFVLCSSVLVSANNSEAQTNNSQVQSNQTSLESINLGSFTPVTIYLTQAGGLFPGYEHTMFDSNSMQKMKILSHNSQPIFETVSETEYNQIVDYLVNTTNLEFFSPEYTSSPFQPCPDCISTFLTIVMPTFGGTLSNTVYYNSDEEVPQLVRNIIDVIKLEHMPQIN
jgi:hypothetical protein